MSQIAWNANAKTAWIRENDLDGIKWDPVLKGVAEKAWNAWREGQVPLPPGLPHPSGDLNADDLAIFVVSVEHKSAEAVREFVDTFYRVLDDFLGVVFANSEFAAKAWEVFPGKDELEPILVGILGLDVPTLLRSRFDVRNLPFRLVASGNKLQYVVAVPDSVVLFVNNNVSTLLDAAQGALDRHFDSDNQPHRQASDIICSEQHLAAIRQAFDQFDTDRSGTISRSELAALCAKVGKELNQTELEEAFNVLDADVSGTIEFEEFLEWWNSRDASTGSRLAAVKAALRVNYSSLKTIKNALANPKPWESATYDLDIAVGDTAALAGTSISITVNPNRELAKLLAAQHFQVTLNETLGAWIKGLISSTNAVVDIAQNASVKAQLAIPVTLVSFVSDLIAKDKYRWYKERRYKFDLISRFLANFGTGLTTSFTVDNLRVARDKAVASLYDDFLRIIIKSGQQSQFTDEELQLVRELISNPASFYTIGSAHHREAKFSDAVLFAVGGPRDFLNAVQDEPREFVEEVLPMLGMFVPLFDQGLAWFSNGGFRKYIDALSAKAIEGDDLYRSTFEEVLEAHFPAALQGTPVQEPFSDVVSGLCKNFFKPVLKMQNEEEWKEAVEAMGLDAGAVKQLIDASRSLLIKLFEELLPAGYKLVCNFRFLSNVSAVSAVAQIDFIRFTNHGASALLDSIPDFPALAETFFTATKGFVLPEEPHNEVAKARQATIRKISQSLGEKESSIRTILRKHVNRFPDHNTDDNVTEKVDEPMALLAV